MKSFFKYTAILFLLTTANTKAPFLPPISVTVAPSDPIIEFVEVIDDQNLSSSQALCWYQTVLFALYYGTNMPAKVSLIEIGRLGRPLITEHSVNYVADSIPGRTDLLLSVLRQTLCSFYNIGNVMGLYTDIFLAFLTACAKANYKPCGLSDEQYKNIEIIYQRANLVKIFGRYPTNAGFAVDSKTTPIITLRSRPDTHELERSDKYYSDLISGFQPFERVSTEFGVLYGDHHAEHAIFAKIERRGTSITKVKIFDSSNRKDPELFKRLVSRMEHFLCDLEIANKFYDVPKFSKKRLEKLKLNRLERYSERLKADVNYIGFVRKIKSNTTLPPIR